MANEKKGTTQLTDAELRVFHLLVDAVRRGQAALLRVPVHGVDRAGIASYEKKEGRSTLAVYGLLLTAEELVEVNKALEDNQLVAAPPEDSEKPPEVLPTPMPPEPELGNYLSVVDSRYTLRDMLEHHNRKVEVASSSVSEANAEYEEFVDMRTGHKVLAVAMLQLFTQPLDAVIEDGACPFCVDHPDLDSPDEWSTCPTCGAAWAAGGRYRPPAAKKDEHEAL